MRRFSNYSSVEDILKESQFEILLAHISVSSSGYTRVLPTKCPGVGRKDDILTDSNGEQTCVLGGAVCPYFSGAEFTHDGYEKKVLCEVAD